MNTITFSSSVKTVFFIFFFFAAFSPHAYAQYCDSYGDDADGYTTGTRRVIFNTIDNATPIEDNGYSDFTSISTTVNTGDVYNLTVRVNTDGNYTVYARAWFDWNQDNDFEDSGEQLNLGSARNVTNGTTSASPFAVTIPPTATVGTTRMRIGSKYKTYPGPCDDDYDGEVEDYSIIINAATPTPEIEIMGNGHNIGDGDTVAISSNHTNFGDTTIANTITRTFTINNTGTADLDISAIAFTGGDLARFTITSNASPGILIPGASTLLVIEYTPTTLVSSMTTVEVTNTDADENPFTFAIQGEGIDPSALVDIYCEDFESGTGSWANTTTTNGAWGQGTEGTASGGATGNYFFTERDGSGQYSDDSNQVVTSPVIDMTAYEKITFSIDVWYDMSNDAVTTPDGFQIKFSEDGGTSWYVLGDARGSSGANWYNSDSVTGGANGWTNISSGWKTAIIDLHSQAFDNNANVQFRVSFRSDSGTNDVGVAFDNVCITGFPVVAVIDPSCGPAGIGTNLALWLRADAGTSSTTDGGSISEWVDQAFGSDYTNATAKPGEEPQYRNNATDNVNFHPVVKFDPSSSNMKGRKGFFTDEFYIVVKPTNTISSATGANDVYCADDYRFHANAEDVTGFEMGNTSARFTDDIVGYNLGPNTNYGIAQTSTTATISGAHIFNGRTNVANTGANLYQDGLSIGNTVANAATFA
ncbi:MAG: hypothetical protein ACI828_002874, partial [Flavobacteriales bacterium]